MLTKLLKYEFKATARYFVPMIVALLAIAVANRICFNFDANPVINLNIPSAIAMTLYVAILMAIGVLALVITIKRFHSSLLTDEGYLMMTLPVSVDTHIISKIITSGVWLIASGVATMASVLILVYQSGMIGEFFTTVSQTCAEITDLIGAHLWIYAVLCVIICLLCLVNSLTTIYMCIAIGHQMPKHQALTAIGAYIGYSTILQVLMVICGQFVDFTGLFDIVSGFSNIGIAYTVILVVLVVALALVAFTYCMTRFLLKRHLNLE